MPSMLARPHMFTIIQSLTPNQTFQSPVFKIDMCTDITGTIHGSNNLFLSAVIRFSTTSAFTTATSISLPVFTSGQDLTIHINNLPGSYMVVDYKNTFFLPFWFEHHLIGSTA